MRIFAMWRHTAARTLMLLTKLEREVITDSMLKIQSIQASLDQIDDSKLVDSEEINSCLKTANRSFRTALRIGSPEKKPNKR
jgi:hypothetical protein